MTVTALVTRNDITATASQTSFTYTFRVLAATDMDVYQNGVLLSSGYTVNNVGNTTGGTVTLDSGVPVGQIVSLVLAMPLDRTTNYQNSGKFLADAHPMPPQTAKPLVFRASLWGNVISIGYGD